MVGLHVAVKGGVLILPEVFGQRLYCLVEFGQPLETLGILAGRVFDLLAV